MDIHAIAVTAASAGQPESPRAARAEAAPAPAPQPAQDPRQVARAVEVLNRAMTALSREVEFTSDQQTGHTVVRVLDRETQEVIRQIPSQEVLSITHALDRLQGLLFQQKA